MSRILLLYWGRRGGGAHYAYHLARSLAARSDIELFVSYSRQGELAGQFRSLKLPSLPVRTYTDLTSFMARSTLLPAHLHRLRTFVRRHDIRVVINAMPHPWSPLFPGVVHGCGASYAVVVHDGQMHPGEQNAILAWWWDREVAKADYVFTLTNHVADLLRQRFGTGLSPMAIVPHGPILPPRTREALGCKTDARSRALLHFGRLLPYKGLDLLADAFAELRLSHPGTTLVVAGGGDLDKANGGRLRDMPGVRIENRYLDEVEIETLMDSSDVLVLPYREASQSGVVAVAHARGLPVVVTPVGGLTEQVIDGETGVVAAGVDAASVHDAVARLLDDPALARHCALVAVERGERMWEEAAASVCRTVLLESTSEPASSHPARART